MPKSIKGTFVIKIVNVQGKPVYEKSYDLPEEETLEVNTTSFQKGLYFFELLYDKKFLIKSFVKDQAEI